MSRILGIDVGTNSLGMVVRDEDISNNPQEQIVYSSVNLFKSGVGNGKSGEFSFAAERTKSRSQRKIYKVRRYRKWATLKLLINEGLCPLKICDLEKWVKYDKKNGLSRQYPIDNFEFNSWIKLDFDSDGVPDYTSPYELRNELATKQFDFNEQINLYKLGRAIYHIAQRRGFKSSKGDTIAIQENEDSDSSELKQSEIEKSAVLNKYMAEHSLPTVGCALFDINQQERVRKEYPVIRKMLKDEIDFIFNFQNGLNTESDLFVHLMSEKKNVGTIFYKRPLQSQKGQVGKCMLEPSKPRCPQSRPEFEEFRAWSFINTIRFGSECKQELTLQDKAELFNDIFIRVSDFQFSNIRKWIENRYGIICTHSLANSTINYKDNVKIPSCVVIYRLQELLGKDWKNWKYESTHTHTSYNKSSGEHTVTYSWEDVWHVCFGADDEEPLESFAVKSNLGFSLIAKLWNSMPIAYANLSLKAINNINRFLKKGMLYNQACMLAKLPDIFKDRWNDEMESVLFNSLSSVIEENAKERRIVNIANTLIANYKSLPDGDDDKPCNKLLDYVLCDDDYKMIEAVAMDSYGPNTWQEMSVEEKQSIISKAADLYQQFFADARHEFIKVNRVDEALISFLRDNFDDIPAEKFKNLYHHSQIEYYKPSKERQIVKDDKVLSLKLLGSPAISAIRNPMALRVLHTLRRKVNDMLLEGVINPDDTRIVVEVARELNDANMRWAINKYQEIHHAENNELRKLIAEFVGNDSSDDIKKAKMLVEQHECTIDVKEDKKKQKEELVYQKYMDELVKKYKLWGEQGGFCIYTGKPITITSILNGGTFDIEHTIPRSKSFDDSMSNKTLCDSNYNRNVKGNKLPSELPEEDYAKILQRISPWIKKIDTLKSNVDYWKSKSKKAQTKDAKDMAIRQIHLWRMELDYWEKKVGAFKMKEVKSGFRNSQLVDTSIIAKYAMHFLKTVFNRVDVQKGSNTANFRKILGIQDDDTLKVRDSNSHHAIDALVLTYIPVAAQRDKLLKLFFEKQEAKHLQHDYSTIDASINLELTKCRLKYKYDSVIQQIKDSVLAFYEQKNQALSLSSKRKRVRGKIVPVLDVNNHIIFEKDSEGNYKLDANGHKIPMAKQWKRGDSIRGDLHDKTYLGAITQNSKDEIFYVVRRDLTPKVGNSGNFSSWDDLEKNIVNKSLVKMMKKQFPDGTSFKDACAMGIFMLNKDGEKINKIHHVRCYSATKNPKQIRKQTYASRFEYKNYFYAKNGENIAYALYEDAKGKRAFECCSLLDAAAISSTEGKHRISDVFPEYKEKGKSVYKKKFVLLPGQMVLLKTDDLDFQNLLPKDISNRLYVFRRIFNPKDGNLQFQHHLETRNDNALMEAFPKAKYGDRGKNGFPSPDFEIPYPRLLLSMGNLNLWIEGVDFSIVNGKVVQK